VDETRGSANHVGDGVERPDFVEVDVFNRYSVHGGFGCCESFEYRRGHGPNHRVEAAEESNNVAKMSHHRRVGNLDMNLGRPETGPLHRFGPQNDAEIQRIDRACHDLKRHACVDHRAQHHVAAGARSAVEPTDHAAYSSATTGSNDNIRTAAHAAPNPLSMLTTVTP
jgi:hypothetical protein